MFLLYLTFVLLLATYVCAAPMDDPMLHIIGSDYMRSDEAADRAMECCREIMLQNAMNGYQCPRPSRFEPRMTWTNQRGRAERDGFVALRSAHIFSNWILPHGVDAIITDRNGWVSNVGCLATGACSYREALNVVITSAGQFIQAVLDDRVTREVMQDSAPHVLEAALSFRRAHTRRLEGPSDGPHDYMTGVVDRVAIALEALYSMIQ